MTGMENTRRDATRRGALRHAEPSGAERAGRVASCRVDAAIKVRTVPRLKRPRLKRAKYECTTGRIPPSAANSSLFLRRPPPCYIPRSIASAFVPLPLFYSNAFTLARQRALAMQLARNAYVRRCLLLTRVN